MSETCLKYTLSFDVLTGIFRNYKVVKKDSDQSLLMQVSVNYTSMKDNRKKELVADVNELIITKHPNLLYYIDRFVEPSSGTLYLLTRYCCGPSLKDILESCYKTDSFLDEKFIWKALKQIGSALTVIPECRKNSLVSVYIQPAQVFIDSTGNLQLAYIFTPDDNKLHGLHYISPEHVNGVEFNAKTRTWCLGLLIYELCTREFPLRSSILQFLAERIRLPRIPSVYSDQLQNVIELMLTVDVELRPTVDIVLHFPSLVTMQSDIDHFSALIESLQTEGSDFKNLDITYLNHSKHYLETDLDTVMSALCLSQTSITCGTQTSPKPICRCLKYADSEQNIVKDKLNAIHKREILQKEKEERLREISYNLEKREKKVCLLEKMVKSKLHRAEVYLKQCKEIKNNEDNGTYVTEESFEQTNTAAKLDPLRYPNPFADKTNKSLFSGKENRKQHSKLSVNNRLSFHNESRHKEEHPEVHKRLSWNDDCYLWLKNKKQSYDRTKSKSKIKLRC